MSNASNTSSNLTTKYISLANVSLERQPFQEETFQEKNPEENIFVQRKLIWEQTKKLAPTFPFTQSQKYLYSSLTLPKKFEKTNISVQNIDTIVIGKELQEKGYNPLLLNFADDICAGGAVNRGSGAQEESLFRRTNLCNTLLQEFYPILPIGKGSFEQYDNSLIEGIYSPSVTVFRDTEQNEYKMIELPYQTSFVAVPGIPYPNRKNGRLYDDTVELLKNKIRLIFEIGSVNGHDALVLGALGCGAWGNPPQHVAEIFRDICREFDGVFREIVFPCLKFSEDGYDNSNLNYNIFKSVLVPE
jgi:uncharacterized protein (TIGR02452 family)